MAEMGQQREAVEEREVAVQNQRLGARIRFGHPLRGALKRPRGVRRDIVAVERAIER